MVALLVSGDALDTIVAFKSEVYLSRIGQKSLVSSGMLTCRRCVSRHVFFMKCGPSLLVRPKTRKFHLNEEHAGKAT